MDLKQLDHFLVLYRLRSVRRAAETLYISQQGLSRSIRELERELGTMLFIRSSQGMTPTRAGDYFYEQVSPLVDRFGIVCRNVAFVKDDAREIEIPCAFGTLNLLYGSLKRFMSEKGVSIRWEEVSDRSAEQRVLTAQQPLGISVRNDLEGGLEFLPLGRQAIVAMVPEGDPLSQQSVIQYDDLRGRPIIIEGPSFNVHQFVVDRCLTRGFEPVIAVETTEISLCIRLASMGEGIAILPDFIARQGVGEHVVTLPFADQDCIWEYGLIWRKGSTPTGAYADLVEWLPAHI